MCIAAGAACDTLVTSTSTSAVCTTSATSTACTGGTTSCGGLGQACCVSTYSSSSSYYYCGAANSRCLSNSSTSQYVCTACGDKGQRCCVDSIGSAVGCKAPYLCNYDSSSGYYNCVDPASVPAGNCGAAFDCCMSVYASASLCQTLMTGYSDSTCADFILDYCY
jgi:hypothetical protein